MPKRDDATARVMVFVDGQNLHHQLEHVYGKRTRVHPTLLARELAGNRQLVGVRFYSGVHSRDVNASLREMTDRRHQFIRTSGATVVERELMYSSKLLIDRSDHNAHGRRPLGERFRAQVFWHRQGREKGIDLRIALDAMELALDDMFDVGVIVSSDTDLCEIPHSVHDLTARYAREGLVRNRVSFEAAVVSPTRPSLMPHYDYTHGIDATTVARCAENIDFARATPQDLTIAATMIRKTANITSASRGHSR